MPVAYVSGLYDIPGRKRDGEVRNGHQDHVTYDRQPDRRGHRWRGQDDRPPEQLFGELQPPFGCHLERLVFLEQLAVTGAGARFDAAPVLVVFVFVVTAHAVVSHGCVPSAR